MKDSYRKLFDNSPLCIGLINNEGNIVEANRAMEKLLNMKTDDIIGKNYLNLSKTPSKYHSLLKERLARIANGEILEPAEIEMYNEKGETFWVSAFSSLVMAGDETLIQIIIQDVDERHRKQEELKAREEKYKHLFEISPFGIILLDENGTVIDTNDTIGKEFGYSKQETIGKNFFQMDFLLPEYIDYLKQRFALYKEGVKLEPIELQIKKKDGSLAWINPYVSLIQLGGSNYVQIITKDITEKILATKKLEESEEKFRTITEQSFMGILILQDDVIKYANEQISNMFGYSNEEILNWAPNHFINVIHPEDRELVVKRAKMRQDGILQDLNNYQFRIITKQKETVWVEIFSKAINYGGKTAALTSIMDVSKEKQTEDLLIKELNNLRRTVKKRRDFMNRMSHELKNPLTTVNGSIEFLTELLKDNADDDVNDVLSIIMRGSDRLKKIIDELLEMAHLEENGYALNKRQENLTEIVKESVKNMVHMLKERNLSLNLDVEPDITAKIDKLRVEQVFNNLISNAIKNTPKEGKIHVSLGLDDHSVIFKVKDTGIGLKESDMDKLFKEFSRIERDRDDIINKGTGLGLYLSKSIVKMHGGEINAESKGENKGATFTVRLPIE